MIPKGLFTQIIMMIIGVAIIITYVQPNFAEISDIQEQITVYQAERAKVSAVNARLAGLVQEVDTISASDQRKLLTYLPDNLDDISVQRDLYLIALQAGLSFNTVTVEAGDSRNSLDVTRTGNFPTPYQFSLNVEGTYGQIKEFLRLAEQNHYPLDIYSLDVSKLEGGFLVASIGVVAYEYLPDDTLLVGEN